MNLIEQFGGYEAAKVEFNNTSSDQYGYKFSLQMALLKHRRHHNIFEVGDKVVSKHENLNLFGDVVLEIEYFRKLSSVVWVRFTNENDYRVDALRHATPEEIAAGRRL